MTANFHLLTKWPEAAKRLFLRVKNDLSQWLGSLSRFVRRLKPYADVLLPLALVYFAYKTDEVTRQQATTQQLQAEQQKLQSQPVFEIDFTDDEPLADHKDANINIKNHGGPAFEWRDDTSPAVELLISSSDNPPFAKIYFIDASVPNDFSSTDDRIRLSNMDYGFRTPHLVSVEWNLRSFDKIRTMVKNLDFKDYRIEVRPVIVLQMNWRNFVGSQNTRYYIMKRYSMKQTDIKPNWTMLPANTTALHAAFEATLKEQKYTE